MNRSLATLATALLLCPVTMGFAHAQLTFTGAAGAPYSWFDAKNWDQGKLPGVDDNATIVAPIASAKDSAVIDNTLDPAAKDKIAFASRLMVGDGNNVCLVIKTALSLGDNLRVGNSDSNHTGNGTVIQLSGAVHPGDSPQIGTTAGLTGTYFLRGGSFGVGDTSLYIGGNASSDPAPGKGSFVISGGKFSVGNRIIFGDGGSASFTVIGSQAESIGIGDQFNQDGTGKVDLNVQIDQGGLTPITTALLGLSGITLYPSFAEGVPPHAGTWTVVTYDNLVGKGTAAPVLGKSIDAAHWSAKLDTDADKLTVTYKP